MAMFLQPVRSPGLAHISYIFGDGSQAAVVDPRRDVDKYLEIARRHEATITHIFETHRNEDYVIGSKELARRTGATIHHGKALDFTYGEGVADGDTFTFGSLKAVVLETPGHTFESISLALYDSSTGDDCVGVFTGDALFIGDVGRTDFFPDRKEEVAGLLYDSIFEKLLPLGDQAILWPAHGAGSVCGSGMADRDFSTIGLERQQNAALQVHDKQAFVQRKIAETHYQPHYFRKMEELNLHGTAPAPCSLPAPKAVGVEEFARRMEEGMQVVDVRDPEAFAGAAIPGSLALPLNMLSAYAGYYLEYDKDIGLVADRPEAMEIARIRLHRLGYDRVACFLPSGLTSWEVSGRPYHRVPAVHVDELVNAIQEGEDFILLDVRKHEEVAQGMLPGAKHIFLGDLPDRVDELQRDKRIVTFCGSGQRAIIAASLLERAGFEQVEDALGSMAACEARGCPIQSSKENA